MNTRKLALILKKKRDELFKKNHEGRTELWIKYLKEQKIKRTGIAGLTKMANKGQLQGKTTVQTDISLKPPATQKQIEENYLPAHDVMFYVIPNDTAEKILVLGLP